MLSQITELREVAFPTPTGRGWRAVSLLEIERDGVVRARILLDCAFVEEVAALLIMHRILAGHRKWERLKYFGKIKRYRVFADDILGRLPARHKISVAKKFMKIPKKIAGTLDRMLALRDVLAHVYTLDDRSKALQYGGISVLTKAGLELYMRDATTAITWLLKRLRPRPF